MRGEGSDVEGVTSFGAAPALAYRFWITTLASDQFTLRLQHLATKCAWTTEVLSFNDILHVNGQNSVSAVLSHYVALFKTSLEAHENITDSTTNLRELAYSDDDDSNPVCVLLTLYRDDRVFAPRLRFRLRRVTAEALSDEAARLRSQLVAAEAELKQLRNKLKLFMLQCDGYFVDFQDDVEVLRWKLLDPAGAVHAISVDSFGTVIRFHRASVFQLVLEDCRTEWSPKEIGGYTMRIQRLDDDDAIPTKSVLSTETMLHPSQLFTTLPGDELTLQHARRSALPTMLALALILR